MNDLLILITFALSLVVLVISFLTFKDWKKHFIFISALVLICIETLLFSLLYFVKNMGVELIAYTIPFLVSGLFLLLLSSLKTLARSKETQSHTILHFMTYLIVVVFYVDLLNVLLPHKIYELSLVGRFMIGRVLILVLLVLHLFYMCKAVNKMGHSQKGKRNLIVFILLAESVLVFILVIQILSILSRGKPFNLSFATMKCVELACLIIIYFYLITEIQKSLLGQNKQSRSR